MTTPRKLSSADVDVRLALARLLQDAVHGGASVGFLAPLHDDVAVAYWDRVLGRLGSDLHLWVAESDGEVVGSVQIELCGKQNGRHRAEVQKLIVLTVHRGKGIASLLMRAAEEFAATRGRTLLVLDTQAGSAAESIYRHLGWLPAGQIPNYAASPDGKLHATAYFYKHIAD